MIYTNGQTVHRGDRVRGYWPEFSYDVEGIVEDIDENSIAQNLWVSWMDVSEGFTDTKISLVTASTVALIAPYTGNLWAMPTPPPGGGDLQGDPPDLQGDPL